MSIRRRTVNSHSTTSSEKTDVNINPTQNNTESTKLETSLDPNTRPTENTPQNPLQTHDSSHCEIITKQTRNPS